jgi:hypothetical protein
MSAGSVEDRLAALEAEVARLRTKLEEKEEPAVPWWKKIAGTFEGDPYYAEAMRLGREYRQSLRPKRRNQKRKRKPK